MFGKFLRVRKPILLTALVIFFLTFGIYVYLISPTVGGGDGGDLITAAYVLGVPHPPGYPLYTLIAHLFTLLPFGPSIAWKVNLFSALCQSLTVAVVFLIVHKITGRVLASIIASLSLAFSFTFWFYAETAEVFPLNNLLISLLIFFTLNFYFDLQKTKKTASKWIYFMFLVLGLGVANHQTILFTLPSIFILLFLTRKKVKFDRKLIFRSILLFFLGLSFYVYIPITASSDPPVSWDNVKSLKSFIQIVTRADYGSFNAVSLSNSINSDRFRHFLLYLKYIWVDFTFWGVLLGIIGIIFSFFKEKKLFYFLILGFLILGVIFQVYANFPLGDPFLISVIERFLLGSYVFFAIFIGIGVSAILFYFEKFSSKDNKLKILFLILPVFLIFIPFFLFVNNFAKADQRRETYTRQFISDLFATVEPNSIVFISEDTGVFSGQYFHHVENLRPDITILTTGIDRDWAYSHIRNLYPNFKYSDSDSEENRFINFVSDNLDTTPIYIFMKIYNDQRVEWVPQGLLYRGYRKENVPSKEQTIEANNKLFASYSPPVTSGYKSILYEYLTGAYARSYNNYGNFLLLVDENKLAIDVLVKGLKLNPDWYDLRFNYAVALALNNQCLEAIDQLKYAHELRSWEFQTFDRAALIYNDCLKDENKAKESSEKARELREKIQGLPNLEEF